MFNKVKSMSFTECIQVVRNEYITVQVIPAKSSRNNRTDTLALVINKMYMKLNQLVRIENRKLIMQCQMKAAYYIHMTQDEVKFYFIIPKVHYMKFKSKLTELWKNVDLKEVDSLPVDVNDCSKFGLRYKMKDILSLDVNKTNNDLLNANFSVLDVIKDDEFVGILYNFIPTAEKESNYFKNNSRQDLIDYKNGKNLKRNKSIIDVGIVTIKWVIELIEDILDGFINSNSGKYKTGLTNTNSTFISHKDTSPCTKRKLKKDICKSQIVVLSKSNDEEREKQLGISACNTFKSISDDNELVYKELKTPIHPYASTLNKIDTFGGVDTLYTTTDEVSNFLATAGRELIEEYKIIEHKPVIENPVPKCLQNGNMFIGLVNYKEQVYKAFFSMHEEFKNLERVLIGSKGSGKSYKMAKMAKNAIELGNGVVVIDIIEDCKLSKSIAEATPKDRLLRIRCDNLKEIQGYVYNEIPIDRDNMTPYQIFSNAVKRTQLLQSLFNAINDDDSQLSPRMIKYLFAAGSVVYSCDPNASLNDVLECLEYPNVRYNFINSLSDELKGLLKKRIKKLSELDDVDSKGNIKGNKDTKIDGILDRAALLDSMSSHLEIALNRRADNNINFVDALRENKVILIEIPEQEFPSQMLRNIMATFFLSKVWAAKQILGSEDYQPTTELFFDEFYKCYNCQILFETIFAEARKYRLITNVAIHNLGQLSQKCRMTLRSGGASYMLLAGADVQAYKELQTNFEKFGYDEKAFLDLKTYSALCLIKNEDENYSVFVADFPK